MQTRIALYPSNEFEFKNQGYGILADTLSAVTTEEAQSNGNIKHELTLVYPLGGRLADELRKPNLIRAPIDGSEDKYNYQVFEIYDYLDDDADGTITVYAQAIGYRVLRMPFDNGGYIKHSGTVQQVLSYAETLISGWPEWFMLRSDLTQTVEIDSQFENLGKFIDHLLALTDAQIEHKWNELWIRDRGEHLKPVLRDDKNTIGVTIKHDYDTIINKIIPEYEISGEEGESTKVVGAPILSANPFKYFEYWRGKTIQFKDQSETVDYFSKSGLDEPSLTADIKPNLVDVDFDSVQLFDYVRVKNYKLNFEKELRITSRTFDALACRVTDFKAGSIESNLTTSTTAQIESATSTANDALATADDSKKGVEKLDIIMAETKKKVEEVDQAVIDAARDTKLAVDQADLAVEKATTAAENAGFAKDTANLSVQSAAQAQKDVETVTTNANQALNSAKTALTNAGDAIKTATDAKTSTTNLATTVDSINGTIATLATNETVDKLSKTVTSQGTSITQNANAIALKADSTTVNTLAGSVQTLDSQLKFTNAALAAKITKSDVTSMLGGYATQTWTTSEIKAQADSINLGVESVRQKVDGLQVGGRNLLMGTSGKLKTYSGDSWSSGNLSSTNISLTSGQTYTARMWIQDYDVQTNLTMRAYDAGGTQIAYVVGNVISANSSGYSTATWTADSKWTNKVIATLSFTFQQSAIHSGQYKELKLEKGNVATDWSPAPEDMATVDWATAQLSITDSKIDSSVTTINGNLSTLRSDLTQTSDSLKSTISKVDENTTNYSSLEQKLNGFQTTVAGKADKSQITQLAGQITSVIGGMRQKNLITNTEFNDLSEWGFARPELWQVGTSQYYSYKGSNTLLFQGLSNTNWTSARSNAIPVADGEVISASAILFAIGPIDEATPTGVVQIETDFYDTIDGPRQETYGKGFNNADPYAKQLLKLDNIKVPASRKFVRFSVYIQAGARIAIAHPMVVKDTFAGEYQPNTVNQSQITQLTDDINLRVQKGDVINQINISPESVLISGKKVHITGQTTIDQAVIKSSMIESLSANKINVGTLSGLSLYGNSIEGGTIDGDVHIRSIRNGQYSVMSPEGVTVSTSYDKVALDPNGIVSVSNAVRIYKDSYMSGDYISIYKGSKGLGLYYLFGGHAWVLTTAEMENVY